GGLSLHVRVTSVGAPPVSGIVQMPTPTQSASSEGLGSIAVRPPKAIVLPSCEYAASTPNALSRRCAPVATSISYTAVSSGTALKRCEYSSRDPVGDHESATPV